MSLFSVGAEARTAAPPSEAPFELAVERLSEVIVGKSHAIRLALACMLAKGHLLIEDLPGVGKNLQDHLNINVIYRCRQPITYDGMDKPLPSLKHGLRFLFTHGGPLTAPASVHSGVIVVLTRLRCVRDRV